MTTPPVVSLPSSFPSNQTAGTAHSAIDVGSMRSDGTGPAPAPQQPIAPLSPPPSFPAAPPLPPVARSPQESDEPARETTLAAEKGILEAVFSAASERDTYTYPVRRKGKVLFTVTIQALTATEYQQARRAATDYGKAHKMLGGVRIAGDTDTAKFNAHLIYRASTPETKREIWDNRELYDRLGVVSGIDLVNRVLLAGDVDHLVAKLDEISGYNVDDDALEEAKNS